MKMNTSKENNENKQCDEPITTYIARVPLPWIAEAAKLPGRAIHAALTILYVHGLHPEHETVLVRSHFRKMNIPRGADRRGMDALQEAKLIRYTREGNSYVVTILPVRSKSKTKAVKGNCERKLTTRTNSKTKKAKTPGHLTENDSQSNLAVAFREMQEGIEKLSAIIAK